MPTFNTLATLTQNLGFAIAIATFLVFMLAVLVVWQMRDLRDMQNRHAAEREASDKRHATERVVQEERHSEERSEWRQTQAGLLARFAEAQERDKFELIGELKQQTRLLERLDDRKAVVTPPATVPTPPARSRKSTTKTTVETANENAGKDNTTNGS